MTCNQWITFVMALVFLAMIGSTKAQTQTSNNEHVQNIAEVSRERAAVADDDYQSLRYSAIMREGYMAWDRGDMKRTLELLESARPSPSETDVRGFEWFHLWKLCNPEVARLDGHRVRVESVAVTTDGKVLATGGWRSVRLWDLSKRLPKHIIEVPEQANALAFSDNGKWLAVGDNMGSAYVCDLNTEGEIRKLTLPDLASGRVPSIHSLAFLPNTEKVLTGGPSYDGTGHGDLVLWDVTSNERSKVFTTDKPITSFAVSPDGLRIAVGEENGNLSLVNVADWNVIRTFAGHATEINDVSFANDGNRLASAAGDISKFDQPELLLWNLADSKPPIPLQGHKANVTAVQFAEDGQLWSCGYDGSIFVWDPVNASIVANFKAHAGRVNAIVQVPGSKELVTAGDEGAAKVWNPILRTIDKLNSSKITDIATDDDGKRLLTVGDKIRFWNLENQTYQVMKKDSELKHIQIRMSSDGTRVAAIRSEEPDPGTPGEDDIVVWDTAKGDVAYELNDVDRYLSTLEFSPDSSLLASISPDEAVLWNSKAGEEVKRLGPHPGVRVTSIAFSPDSKSILVGGRANRVNGPMPISFWNIPTGEIKQTLSGTRGDLYSAVFSKGSDATLATVGFRALQLWDAEEGRLKRTIYAEHNVEPPFGDVVFSPDGNLIAVDVLGEVRLWDDAASRELGRIPAYQSPSIEFSEDGKTLAIQNKDQVQLFNTKTLLPLAAFPASGRSLVFSKDGRFLAYGEGDGVRIRWAAENDETQSPVDSLLKQMGSQSKLIRRNAIDGLACQVSNFRLSERVETEIVAGLLAQLADEDAQVRESIWKTFEELGPIAKPALSRAMGVIKNEEFEVAKAACVALGRIAPFDNETHQALIEATRRFADDTEFLRYLEETLQQFDKINDIDETVRAEESISFGEYLDRFNKLLAGRVFSAVRVPIQSSEHLDIQNWSKEVKKTSNGYNAQVEVYRITKEGGEVKFFSIPSDMFESDGKMVVTESGTEGIVVGLENGGFRTKWYDDGKLILMRDVYRNGETTEQTLYMPSFLKQPAIFQEVTK